MNPFRKIELSYPRHKASPAIARFNEGDEINAAILFFRPQVKLLFNDHLGADYLFTLRRWAGGVRDARACYEGR